MKENPVQSPPPQSQIPVAQTLAEPPKFICKYCHAPITLETYFCPTCGKKVKEPPFTFSWGKFIGNMTLTILLPPLGIFPGIRHLKQPDQKAKILGWVYIILTILVTVIMFKIILDFINNINKSLNDTYLMQDYLNDPEGSVQDQTNQLYKLGQ